MARSIKEVIATKRNRGLEDVDVCHWVEKYTRMVVGGGVRCDKVKQGEVVLVASSATVRQELYLIENELREAALREINYKIIVVQVRQFSA